MFLKIIFSLCLLVYISGLHGVNTKEELPFVRFSKMSMNQSANPCADFYNFACGDWKKNNLIQKSYHNLSSTKLFESTLDKLIEDFLKNPSGIENSSAAKKAKKFYSSCMIYTNDSAGIEKSMFGALIPDLRLTKEIDWIYLTYHWDKYGVSPFFQLQMSNIEGDSNEEITIKYPPNSWFSKARDFLPFIIDGGIITDSNKADVPIFHNNLTVLSQNLDEPEIVTFSEFIENHSQDSIDWRRVFNVAFNRPINSNWKIRNYLKNSKEFGSFLQETDLRIVTLYLYLNFFFNYREIIVDIDSPSWEEICLKNAKAYFGAAIMPWLIEQTSSEEWRENVLKLNRQIKDSFVALIDQTVHLDETTKLNAKTKLQTMETSTEYIIGFTDEMKNRTYQDVAFESYEVSEYFVESLVNLLKLKQHFDLRLNSFPSLGTYYAHYSTKEYTFLIPLQYIQYPFYNKKHSEGGLSFIIANDMVITFNYLLNYELIRKLKEEQWFSDVSSGGDKCLKSQFGTVVHENFNWTNSDPAKALITDYIAARIAYDAHLKNLELEPNANSEAASNLNLTQNQLYFLQFAQSMCTGEKSFILARGDPLEYHGLGPIRVNAIVQNMPEFAEAYQCAVGAQMNPEKKCIVL